MQAPRGGAVAGGAQNLTWPLWNILRSGRALKRPGAPHPPALLRRVGVFGLPALRGLVVASARLDPTGAALRLFLLPERRLGLEPVDQELAGLEGRLAVGAGGGDVTAFGGGVCLELTMTGK